ncbi:MAG: 30S ribosomal protein S20 [Candidatus Zixiibacteriota bacterium]|nr:MAG: 30S ribosomal protein S20 [candidate division Zixibacteria bacterium]
MRTSANDRLTNRATRSTMKNLIKELKESKTRADAEEKLKVAISVIDRASQNRVIHRNKAAHIKSQLMSYFNNLSR